jgi:hypothetical protein
MREDAPSGPDLTFRQKPHPLDLPHVLSDPVDGAERAEREEDARAFTDSLALPGR